MFPRSPEHADVLPIIPEAVSVVMLAGTVAFWCHFALKSNLLTGLFRCCQVSAIILYCPTDERIFHPVNRERTATLFGGDGLSTLNFQENYNCERLKFHSNPDAT